ncbi:MAG: hypothetical protein HY916_12380 [Desulfovibrio sp.]|jgi:hypothetical protein|nr:hypothetical protein [Desulfovibrio sp.]
MTGRLTRLMAPLPLFAAFVAAPLAVLAGKLAGRPEAFQPFGMRGLAPWLALSGLALAASLWLAGRSRAGAQKPAWPLAAAGLGMAAAAWLLARWLGPILEDAPQLAPLLADLRLPALALFAGLWAWSFGAPERRSLAHAGAALGALVVLDFLLTAIMARSVVLGGGYLFGESAGTADLLAFLLCLGLAATLDDEPRPGHPRLARWLILAGLLAGFSRPGLAAAAVMLLLLEQGPFRQRLTLALSCLLVAWMSLTLPLPQLSGGDELGLPWHYAATMEALRQEPSALLTGLPLDQPMALAMPEFQGLLWDEESQGLPVYSFDMPSSGLRLLAGWGIGGPLAVLAAAGFCAWRGRGRFGLGLLAPLVVGAALTPALHIPATAGALALALASAAHRARPADQSTTQHNPAGNAGAASGEKP